MVPLTGFIYRNNTREECRECDRGLAGVVASERMNESGRELLDKYFEGWMKWRAFIS